MLNETGFQRQEYEEIVLEIEERAKQIYGYEWSINDHSVIGMLIRIWAWFLTKHQQLIENVYLSGFASTATGVSLDRVGGNSGLFRKQATHALVSVRFTGTPGATVPTQTLLQTETGVEFVTLEPAVLDIQGNGECLAVSQLAGAGGNVGRQTIKQFVTPVQGVNTVTNEKPAEGGYGLEPDTDYRKRLMQTQRGALNTSIDGIVSKVAQVPGVRDVLVRVLPLQGLQVVVDGGEEALISQAIFNSVSAGVATIGERQTEVEDIAGHSHTVRYDEAEPVAVSVRITLKVSSNFSETSLTAITEEIQEYILNTSIGSSVSYSRLFGFAYAQQGVEGAEVKLGFTNSVGLPSDQDLLLRENETAVPGFVEVRIND